MIILNSEIYGMSTIAESWYWEIIVGTENTIYWGIPLKTSNFIVITAEAWETETSSLNFWSEK